MNPLIITTAYAVLVHVMWGVVCYRNVAKQAWYTGAQAFWIALLNALPVVIIFSMIHSAIKGEKP